MFRITYKLTGTGWSECVLHADGGKTKVTASYLGDALGDLARAVLAVHDGTPASRCSFEEEPGKYRWLFNRAGDLIDVRILLFDRLWGGAPDADGKPVFHATVGVSDLVGAMAAALRAVLDENGLRGYRGKWVGHGFPVREYRRLTLAAKRNA